MDIIPHIRTAVDIRMEKGIHMGAMNVTRLMHTVTMVLVINANTSTVKSKVVCRSVGCMTPLTQVRHDGYFGAQRHTLLMALVLIPVNVKAFNSMSGHGPLDAIKPYDQRLDTSKWLESDDDEQLIIRIPFTGSVKLKAFSLASGSVILSKSVGGGLMVSS
jgi:hypothetical protein